MSCVTASGIVIGVTTQALENVIAMDPWAVWNPDTRRVDNSAFGLQSPRVFILPVFDPEAFSAAAQSGTFDLRIVGFVRLFLESFENRTITGHLTAYSEMDLADARVQASSPATLRATLNVPGGPLSGVEVDFELGGVFVGTAVTDFQGIAVLENVDTSWFGPGQHAQAIRARRDGMEGFVLFDEKTADLDVAPKMEITWPDGPPLRYGTALSADDLNAAANVPGYFVYNPELGAVLDAGAHTLTARFFPEDQGLYEVITVTRVATVLPRPTTVALNAPATSIAGQAVAVTAAVDGGLGTAPGIMELRVDGAVVSTVALSGGTAVFQVTGLLAGSHTFQAAYLGSQNFQSSASPVAVHAVTKSASTTTLALSTSASRYGQLVTMTVTVLNPSGVPAAGIIEVKEGGTVVGTATLSPQGDAAVATVTSSSLAAGVHQLRADYLGSATLLQSSSAVAALTVIASDTATMLTTGPNPSRTREAVTVRATVSAIAPGGGTPTGTVEFFDGTLSLGSMNLVNGAATIVVSSLKTGKHQLQARFIGAQNYAGSVSNVVTHQVKGGR